VSPRLVAPGTRVVVLKGPAPHVGGVVREVRLEPHLKTYVVTCDDGTTVFASGYDLAHESDVSGTPLAPRPEY
jgi:hypothetical protein